LPEDTFSCDHAKIGFDYKPDLEMLERDPSFQNSDRWMQYPERCEEIVYANRTLDIVLFRVTKDHYSFWKDRPILPILPGTASFPSKDDRLFILQYPAPGNPGCSTIDAARLQVYDGYQMEQQLSIWSRRDSGCRLIRRGSGSIRWYSARDPYAPNSCELQVKRGSGPNISIVHFCDTCPMSSGSPILSLDGDRGRACTVIGMHTHSGDSIHHLKNANVGLRLSVLGECLDFHQTQSTDHLVIREANGSAKPECRADIPKNIRHLDCQRNGIEKHGSICEGYVR
jgi:hypothetical protein